MATAFPVMPPIQKRIGNLLLRLEWGDLTRLAVDAVVFYAREDLQLGSGFGTAIGSRGGDAVKKELAAIGTVKMGEAVVTGAGKLPARHIIHACGPKFQEREIETKLPRAVLSALLAADQRQLKRIAFPPMGAGFYGVPLDLCARTMLDVILAFAPGSPSLQEITICVSDRREFAVFEREMGKV